MYKSVRYIKTKNNTFKLLKDFNDCVDVYVMKQECRNQNSWTDKDYIYNCTFKSMKIARETIYKLEERAND